MAGQLATASFDHQHPQAPDNRMQRPNLNARNEISPWIRWEGMQVYVVQEQKTYQLVGGTGNEHWQEIAAGDGASNFVGQFPTFEDLPDSGSPGDYAYVGTGDDFVQYNWDQIAEEWRLNSAETKVSDEDFFLGRVPSEPDRVMFSMRRNSIIYSTGGSQSISPDRMANYVFTGENVTLENVNYSGDGGEEFHITNRTGSNLTILSTGNFASRLTIPAGHMASFKSSDDGWVQSFVNEEATYSDTLDSVNARVSVGPDGKEVLSGIFDRNTGESVEFKEFDGTPPQPVDGIVWISKNSKIFRRVFDGAVKIQWFGAKADDPTFNSTVAIQAAIDSIYPVIDISGGIFYSSGIINLKSNKKIIGSGTIKKLSFQQSSPILNFPTDTENVTIDGLTLDSNSYFPDTSNANGNSAIRIYGTNIKDVFIKNLSVYNTGRDGVYVNDQNGINEPKNIVIDNCKFYNITRNVLSVINGDGIHFTNNYCEKWNLVAIDFEPNSSTKHLPNRNHTVTGNTFFEFDHDFTQGRLTIQATTGISGAGSEEISRYGNILVDNNTLIVNTVKTFGFFRATEFPKCRVTNNKINNVNANAVLIAASPNSEIYGNVFSQIPSHEYEPDRLLSGVITLSSSDYCSVHENEINGANYNGIHANNSNFLKIYSNITRNIGQAIGHIGDKSHIHLQNVNFSDIHSNTLDESGQTSYSTIGIRCYSNTGRSNYENTIKDNYISQKIPNLLTISNISRQRNVLNNDFSSDSLKIGSVVDSLPTATEYNKGVIHRINKTGSNSDQYFVCIQNADLTFTWREIFISETAIPDASLTSKGIIQIANQDEVYTGENTLKTVAPNTLHNKIYKPPLSVNASSRTFIVNDKVNYLRFTGSLGTLTIPPDVFAANDEVIGEIEGSNKVFSAGIGVNLRLAPGLSRSVPTGSIFKLKFKSANDVLLTYTDGNKSYTNAQASTTLNDNFLSYVRFTGTGGNITIPPDVFKPDDEITGEIEGGAKTFVAGPGVTLRYPAGGTNVAPTNSRFFIRFKSPNDAQLTIVPGVGSSGVSEFTELDDVSVSSLTGHSGKTFVVDPNGEELIPQLLPIKTIRTSGTNNYSPSISGTDPFFILENDFSWLEEYYNNGFRVIKIKVWGFVSNGASSILTFQLFSDDTSGTTGVGIESSSSDPFCLEVDIHIRSSSSSRALLKLTKTGATTESEVFQAINFSDFDRDFDENRTINIQGAFNESSGSNSCLIRSYEIKAY